MLTGLSFGYFYCSVRGCLVYLRLGVVAVFLATAYTDLHTRQAALRHC